MDASSDRVVAVLESVAAATGYLFAADLASLDRSVRLRDALDKDLRALRSAI